MAAGRSRKRRPAPKAKPQPTEFDGWKPAQRELVADLYDRNKRLAQQVANLSHAQLNSAELFHGMPAAYVVHDRLGIIQEVNRAAALLFEVKPPHCLGTSVSNYVSRPDMQLWLSHLQHCLQGKKGLTALTIRSRTGRLIPVQVVTAAAPKSEQRGAPVFRTVLIDISLRRQAEAVEQELLRSAHELVDAIEGIVWEADPRTLDYTFVSRYAERLLGYPAQEWKRPGFLLNHIYFEDRDRIANDLAQVAAKGGRVVTDYRVLTAERRLVWLHDSITLVERQGYPTLLGVAIDVTEWRRAEELLRQTQNQLEQRVDERTSTLREMVAELEAFSYSLSHDLRSPLRAMQGYAELLERRYGEKLDAEGHDYLRRIMGSAERLDLLIKDVLNYSRVASEPIELRPIPLDSLVDTLVHDYAAVAPPNAHIEVQHPLPPVFGHEAFMGQALSNLLTNAVKFMPRGRAPLVRVWAEDVRTETNGLDGKPEPSRWLRICVEDNGVGILPQDQKRIFRMFERIHAADKYEGTGIGLAIVQKAVERMGGRVGVQSALGQGSKFWIELRQPQTVG